jgi:hypothetical protein
MANGQPSIHRPRTIQIGTVVAWFVVPAILVIAAASSSATATSASALQAIIASAIVEGFWVAVFGVIAHLTQAQKTVRRSITISFAFSLAMFATLVLFSIGIMCVITNASTCM